MPASLTLLSTLTPTCNARTWLSIPHPHLPIVATACSDKTARIYSLQNFEQQSVISGGHKRSIRCVAWKPNSKGESVLATGSFDATAGIWKRWEEGAGSGVIGGGGRGQELDFTSGLAGGEEDDGAQDDDDEWRFTVVLEGHDSEIKSLSFSPTAPLLATCSRDKSVWIWEELDPSESGEEDTYETVAVLQEHEGDVKCVAWSPAEALLASGSYDDSVRLWREEGDDWACCCLVNGFGGTVWWVEFEGLETVARIAAVGKDGEGLSEAQKGLLKSREKSGPRLIACSDDCTVRMFGRVPKAKSGVGQGERMPSVWRNRDFEEEWVEDAVLPGVHERPVYAVSWSRTTGRVASTGSDGKIVVYEERWKDSTTKQMDGDGDEVMADGAVMNGANGQEGALTEWVVVAEVDNAHDVFEVNHVCWALRADKGKRFEGEEVLVSTGDDGEVKAWRFDVD